MRTCFKRTGRRAPASLPKFAAAVALSAFLLAAGCGVTGGPAGPQQLAASSANVGFGNVAVGSTTSQLVSFLNKGTTNVTISAVSASGTGFGASGGTNVTLAPNQSVSIYVNFDPAAAGPVSGMLSVASNAANRTVKVGLSGTGVGQKPQTHSVGLAWSPSSSPVIGYFVYRSGSTAGPFSRLNSSVDASASYTDTGLTSGSYFYVVTSVSPQNIESGFSNQAEVNIP